MPGVRRFQGGFRQRSLKPAAGYRRDGCLFFPAVRLEKKGIRFLRRECRGSRRAPSGLAGGDLRRRLQSRLQTPQV
jgi:hypothetical protein